MLNKLLSANESREIASKVVLGTIPELRDAVKDNIADSIDHYSKLGKYRMCLSIQEEISNIVRVIPFEDFKSEDKKVDFIAEICNWLILYGYQVKYDKEKGIMRIYWGSSDICVNCGEKNI